MSYEIILDVSDWYERNIYYIHSDIKAHSNQAPRYFLTVFEVTWYNAYIGLPHHVRMSCDQNAGQIFSFISFCMHSKITTAIPCWNVCYLLTKFFTTVNTFYTEIEILTLKYYKQLMRAITKQNGLKLLVVNLDSCSVQYYIYSFRVISNLNVFNEIFAYMSQIVTFLSMFDLLSK